MRRHNIHLLPSVLPSVMIGLLLLSGGCRKRPKGVLSDSEMTDLMTDLILADAMRQSASSSEVPDSVKRRLGESVLNAHGVDQATLDSTFAWYGRNLDEYYELYARVDKRLAQQSRKLGKAIDGNTVQNDIWSLPKHFLFTPVASSDAIVFELPGETVGAGESLEWQMRMSATIDGDISIGVDYTDGTTSYTSKKIANDRRLRVKIITDTARTARRIFGAMKVDDRSLPVWADSIALSKELFDSTTFSNFRYQRIINGPRQRRISE